MQWNDLTWEMQMQVLDKFGDLLLHQTDEKMQNAMVAAIVELEMWSNTPCKIIEDFAGFEEGEKK